MSVLNKNDLSGIGLSLVQEKLVIKRFVLYSVAITFFYALLAIRNIILKPKPEEIISLIVTIVIMGIFSTYFLIKNHLVAKNYITLIFSFTTIFSFFSYDGITGLFTIDFINIVIFTFILFNEKSLIKYGIYFLLLISSLIFLQFNDLIPTSQNIIYFNPKTDSIIFIFTRLILTVNMILYMKSRHNIERLNLIRKNEEFGELTEKLSYTNEKLLHQNKEVTRQKKLIDNQNQRLKEIQSELVQTNNSLEDRIAIRTEELLMVNGKLKKTLTELDRFVYSASHDLSAPLKSLLGLVHIAKLENKDQHLYEHFDYIEKSINKQEKVITDLIQFSRNSRNSIVPSKFYLKDLIDETTTELRFYPGFNEIKISVNLGIDQVSSDKSRIYMILSNLLSNAIKYRDPGKNKSHILVSSRGANGKWILEVEDNGIGIPRQHQEKIFDMFYRASEESDGTGLGLFIVAEAVEKLNGTITVNSQINKGSTFTIVFNDIHTVVQNT